MSDNVKVNKVKERMEGLMRTSFVVANCPKSTYDDFKELAMKRCGDNYSTALRTLLDVYKLCMNTAMLDARLANLEGEFEQFKGASVVAEPTKPEPRRVNTFGGGKIIENRKDNTEAKAPV